MTRPLCREVVSNMCRVTALEEHYEEVKQATKHTHAEDDVKDKLLPFFGQYSQEEKTKRDF